jgi:ABC-type glycerol-3-phosphate transport system substrate-binding protein
VGCFTSDSPTPVGEQGETIHLLGVVGVHEAIVSSLEKKLAASHIKIEKNFFYWDTYLAKARLAIMNDTGEYDVIFGPCSQLINFSNNEKVIPLNDVAERANYQLSALYPQLKSYVVSDGKIYILPYLADTLIYIYRSDLFKKAGISPPRTIKEMYETGKYLTGDGIYGLAFPASPNDSASSIWSYFLWSHGGTYFDSKWRPRLNSPAALAATQIYTKILQDCAPAEVATWQNEEAINFFASGRLAAMILWSGSAYILNHNDRSKVAGKVNYAPLPIGPIGQAIPRFEAWGVVIPQKSKHIIAAKQFCETLISSDSLAKCADLGMALTPIPLINQRFAEKVPQKPLAVAAKFLTVAQERPNIPEAVQYIPIIGSGLNDILMGAKLKETLDIINQQLESVMQVAGYYK